jgi:hypothetical protein
MARVDDGELYLEIEGATAEQLRNGLAAGGLVFLCPSLFHLLSRSLFVGE